MLTKFRAKVSKDQPKKKKSESQQPQSWRNGLIHIEMQYCFVFVFYLEYLKCDRFTQQ